MATTADSPSSPQIPGGGESINSPQFRRKNQSPAWAQVVRGESESISAVHHHQTQLSVSQPELAAPLSDSSPPKMASPSPPPDAGEGSDGGNDGNAARPKKLAWNKPSNAPSNGGVVEVSPVMGAFSWPALSESTKASPKSSADSTSKTLSDSSLSTSQVWISNQCLAPEKTERKKKNRILNIIMFNFFWCLVPRKPKEKER